MAEMVADFRIPGFGWQRRLCSVQQEPSSVLQTKSRLPALVEDTRPFAKLLTIDDLRLSYRGPGEELQIRIIGNFCFPSILLGFLFTLPRSCAFGSVGDSVWHL